MKTVNNCVVENCIPTPSGCVDWNGGDIEFLGIKNGDSLNNLIIEIVTKLQDIVSDDLSKFDIDSAIDVCNKKAPAEVNLIYILNLLKDNDLCLKEYILSLQETINSLSTENKVNVDLKCLSDFDNLGNQLSLTRDQLDQLVINNLCSQKERIEYLEGIAVTLQNQIDDIVNDDTIKENSITTCVDGNEKPVSSQVKSVATRLCSLETSFSSLVTLVNTLNSTIVSLNSRVTTIENTCCAANCDDISLGFIATFNEDNTALLISFTWGAGTSIPITFEDKGSVGTITDKDGVVQSFSIDIVENFNEGIETEIPLSGALNLTGELEISMTAKIGTDNLNCQKCISGKVRTNPCSVCTVCVNGTEGSTVTIVYESTILGVGGTTSTTSTTSTTTAATTTTTTVAP